MKPFRFFGICILHDWYTARSIRFQSSIGPFVQVTTFDGKIFKFDICLECGKLKRIR